MLIYILWNVREHSQYRGILSTEYVIYYIIIYFHVFYKTSRVVGGGGVVTTPDSQSREPGSESSCYRFETWTISLNPHSSGPVMLSMHIVEMALRCSEQMSQGRAGGKPGKLGIHIMAGSYVNVSNAPI